MTEASVADRSAEWLGLLRRFAARSPRWAVHGDVTEGFTAEGDVDLIAAEGDWPAISEEFAAWRTESGLGPVVVCPHRPGVMVLVALPRNGGPFYELEVRARRHFKGSTLWTADRLAPLTEIAPEGYRRVRAGAAGVLKLLPNGLAGAGGPKWNAAKRDRVARRLAADREGVQAACCLFGLAARAAERGAEAVAAGGWSRRDMLVVEGWALLRSLGEWRTLWSRARFRTGRAGRCAVLEAVAGGRRVPADEDAWLTAVAADHEVIPAAR